MANLLINKILTKRFVMLLVALALSGNLHAATATVTDVDGMLSFNLLSISWDNDFCEMTLTTDDELACGDQGCSGMPDACQSLLQLDGRFYDLSGIMDRDGSGVWTTAADVGVMNCRRADSSTLPDLQPPAIVMNGIDINLDQLANIEIETTHYGARVSMTSSVGDVICDGEIEEPVSLVFADGLENP